MAITIEVVYTPGISTVVFTAEDITGKYLVASTGAVEAYNGAHLANYRVAMTESGEAGRYTATFPTPLVLPNTFHILAKDTALSGNQAIGGGDLILDANGNEVTTVDLTQVVPYTNSANTIGECLNAARVQGFGKWVLVGTTLTLYNADNSVAHTFTLDSATIPTLRA